MIINNMSRRARFKNVQNYAIYYGLGKEAELQKYQLVIVEPKGHQDETIRNLQENDTLVLAYVSVIEVLQSDNLCKILKADDFLKINNQRVINKEYDTVLMNLQSKRWKALLHQHIGNLLIVKNYDGIFLDTLGDIEFDFIPIQLQRLLLNEAFKFVGEIRGYFEDIIILQNNGLGLVYWYTWSFIDGICWENPTAEKLKDKKWINSVVAIFRDCESKGLKMLLLHERKQDTDYNKKLVEEIYVKDLKTFAEKNNLLLYNAAFRYLEL